MLAAHAALDAGWSIADATLTALGDGHIHDTALVTRESGARFVLQRINEQVFRKPERVMANLDRIIKLADARAPGFIPTLIPSLTGASGWVDPDGRWWRLWQFVEGSRSLNSTRDSALARSAGFAFGRFQRLLESLDGPPLAPTITGFLELDGYLADFDLAVREIDTSTAVDQLIGSGAFINSHRYLAERFPPGTTCIHGDCKINNLLFDAAGSDVVCVLDLDTVMQGHWAWDFGDLSRSLIMGGGAAAELFTAVVAGFAVGTRRNLTVAELVDAPVYMAFTLGLRFLTDHLRGDRYFKVRRRGDNFDRAREQFALVQRLQSERAQLEVAAADGLRQARLALENEEI